MQPQERGPGWGRGWERTWDGVWPRRAGPRRPLAAAAGDAGIERRWGYSGALSALVRKAKQQRERVFCLVLKSPTAGAVCKILINSFGLY